MGTSTTYYPQLAELVLCRVHPVAVEEQTATHTRPALTFAGGPVVLCGCLFMIPNMVLDVQTVNNLF